MKREVVIAAAGLKAALAALTFFGAGGVLIGALQAGGARQVARATQSSATDMVIGGVAIFAIGLFVLVASIRQWRAIERIRIEDDGAWTLVPRAGRAIRIAADRELRLELRCRRVFFTWGSAPRIRDVVDGWVVAGEVRRRLAWSGPHSTDNVLGALGLDGGSPRRGQDRRYERPRAP